MRNIIFFIFIILLHSNIVCVAQSICFGNGTLYSGSSSPNSIVSSDFNNDGKKDVIVSDLSGVKVLLGTGTGSFTPSNLYPAVGPVSIAYSDFNSDGNLDLAVANASSNNISILFGLGAGSFSTAVNYAVGSQPVKVISADFNNDGNPDLAVSNAQSLYMNLFLGSSTGVFTPLSGNYAGSGRMASSDFNNDGNKDLAVVGYSISILLGDGFGNFNVASNFSTPLGAMSPFVSGDFNNDGKADLVYTGQGTAYAKTLFVMLGTGNGNFSVSTYSISRDAWDLIGKDLNGDGNLDLAMVDYNGSFANNLTVLMGSGYGTFSNPTFFTVSHYPMSLTSDDFNGDNRMDLVSAGNGYSDITLLSNIIPSGISIVPSQSVVCAGTNVVLNASSANSYSWSTGSTTSSINVAPLSTSVFTVIGTNSINCTNVQTISITVNPAPTITVNSGSICLGQTFTLTPSGANTYTYSSGSNMVSPIANSTYTVTGTGLNGCINSVGAISTVSVNSAPSLTTTQNVSVCVGTSKIVSVLGATSYSWSTSATTASISVLPTSSTIYTVTGTGSNNCSSTKTVAVTVNQNCQDVWPGDVNSDGLVDNTDVLELGLHFTHTGPARATTSNSWQSWFANNWTGTISNGKNVNHSDCNGDGVINNNDILAVINNYSLTHVFKSTEQQLVNSQLSIIPDQAMVAKGTWGTSSVFLGEASTPITNINGLAFTVTFDQNVIDANSFYIEFPASFLNTGNQNLNFSKPDFVNGKFYTATTHTNNINVSGHGKIAVLHYKIKSNLATDEVLNIGITQVKQSNAAGALTPLTAGTATVAAIGASVGVDELSNTNSIGIYPNPANSTVTIHSSATLGKIELLNITGQLILTEKASGSQHRMDVSSVADGVYFVNVYDINQKVTRKKLVVQH